jgi:hypothetical protein
LRATYLFIARKETSYSKKEIEMVTELKKKTNLINSELGTGPITPTGKKYSSQNASRHGFFSRNPALSDVEKKEFENFVSQLEKKYLPSTPLQHRAVRDIAWCTRHCRIALMLEARGMDSVLEEIDP